MTTVEDRASGFDYLRLTLAICVALLPVVPLTYGLTLSVRTFDSIHMATPPRIILPMFFALSGFLVAGSFDRSRTVTAFLGLRMIRIYPALIVQTLLAALVLGPLLTAYSPGRYFSDPDFLRYTLNVTGIIHFFLPGVFLTNPVPQIVDGPIWTITYELVCYVGLAILMPLGMRRWRIIAPILAAVIMVSLALVRPNYDQLIASFLWGVSLYLYRDLVPRSLLLFGVSIVLVVLALYVPQPCVWIFSPALAYATVYLGLLNPKRIFLVQGTDYSYVIFIYHFVIMQTIVRFMPNVWWLTLGLGFAITAVFAALSWHLIEKRALALGHRIRGADRRPAAEAEQRLSGPELAVIRAAAVVVAVVVVGNATIQHMRHAASPGGMPYVDRPPHPND